MGGFGALLWGGASGLEVPPGHYFVFRTSEVGFRSWVWNLGEGGGGDDDVMMTLPAANPA